MAKHKMRIFGESPLFSTYKTTLKQQCYCQVDVDVVNVQRRELVNLYVYQCPVSKPPTPQKQTHKQKHTHKNTQTPHAKRK